MPNSLHIEKAGKHKWENFPEDPVMSRISAHVYCAYRMEFGKEWTRGFLRNHYDRLYFIESGEAEVSTPEQTIHLRPRCVYLIASNVLHRHSCTSGIVMHWCHFQTVLDGFSDLFQEIEVPIEAQPENPDQYRKTFQSLEDSMHLHHSRHHLQRTALLLELIQPHLKLIDPSSQQLAEERQPFQPVLTYIDAHLSESFRIEDLANLLGLNKEYFSRFFRKYFNVPPKQYIVQKRIQRAQKLLCQTEHHIQEIGIRCGYPDPYHFSKCFKQIVGIPPSEYRRRYQQQGTPLPSDLVE